MNDDIVTRLRERAASEAANESYFNSLLFKAGLKEYMINSLSYEAADAIEDYRADLKRHFDMITEQREEIERLQKACDYYHKMCSMIADKNFTANEEIDRLRKELSKWATTPPNRMVCVTHGEMFMCFDEYMGGVYWCEGCRHE